MKIPASSRSISQVLFRLIFFRLYLPLLLLVVAAALGVSYISTQNLMSKQYQVTRTMAQLAEYHLEQGGRILDAVAKEIDGLEAGRATAIMQSTWEAYGYFETLYYLDVDDRIAVLVPSDRRYEGLDLSNLPDIRNSKTPGDIIISRPYISVRTGEPTVLIIKVMQGGGRIVGELKLGVFQQEIANVSDKAEMDTLFIADQNGTLLAHPQVMQVRQQSNISNLKLFQQKTDKTLTSIYWHEGSLLIGTASRISRTGWVVIDQVALTEFGHSYVLILIPIILSSLGLWGILWWRGHQQLQQRVVLPLEGFIHKTKALTEGSTHFEPVFPAVPMAFDELDRLDADFNIMCQRLYEREQALRESELRYRGLFDQVPAGLFRISFSGQFLDVNPAFVQLLGYPDRETLLQHSAFDTLLSELTKDSRKILKIDESLDLSNVEICCQRYDGESIWLLLQGQYSCSQGGREGYCDGSIQDITERKKSAEILRQANDELEKKVQARTAQLSTMNDMLQDEILVRKQTEKELIEKNKEIVDAHRKLLDAQLQIIQQEKTAAIGQLAAGMAHEINNPLAFMISNLELLRRYQENLIRFVSAQENILTGETARADVSTEQIRAELSERKKTLGVSNIEQDSSEIFVETLDGAKRIRDIVKNLMAFSDDSIQYKYADINMALDGAIANIQSQVDPKITFTKELETLPQIYCNIGQLYQVFLNILWNSVQAIKGSGTIRVCSHVTDQDILIDVTDSGTGISQEIQSRIFDPFFTTKDVGKGIGLGLSVAYDIIKKHHGAIEVTSTSGEGATFTIRLPITRE